jgi:hypothetical protein
MRPALQGRIIVVLFHDPMHGCCCMKKLLVFLSLFMLAITAEAQLLESVTAKEILPTVKGAAESGFSQDAVLTHTMFFGIEYQGIRLEMDPQNGKATGWLYRYYSAALDSTMFYVGAKLPIVGAQAVKLPLDTLTQYFPITIGTTGMVEPWVDSDVALQGSKDGGAGTFLQSNPDARISLVFTINNPVVNQYIPQGQYWIFRYVAAADTLTCMVHANTGLAFRCLSGNAPQILSIPPTTARIGIRYTYRVNAFGDPSPRYSLSTAPTGMIIDELNGALEWTPAAGQEGMHAVTVVASNTSGDDTQSFQISVQGAATSPKILSTPVTEAFAGQQYTYQLAASGTPPPAYALTEKPAGMLVDGGRGTVFWTPTRNQAEAHQIRITATNAAGADEQSFVLEVYKSPVIATIANQRIAPDKEFLYQPSTDARPASTYVLNAGPSGLVIDPATGMISWTPATSQIGMHVVLIEASNRAGKGQQSFEIEVDATVGVSPAQQPAGFALISQYPQPVRETLTLEVQTPNTTALNLVVYDMLGRSLVSQTWTTTHAGSMQLTVPLNTLRSGLYTYRLSGGGKSMFRTFLKAN